MDFKKLFRKDDKAVSPVIGVILMVAITVILAAAIGSSVFSQGTAKSAPQANLDVKADGNLASQANNTGTVRLEHLGGDPINFDNTNITAYVGSTAKKVTPPTGTLNVGDVTTFSVGNSDLTSGDVVNIKFVDKETNQLICDKTVRFYA